MSRSEFLRDSNNKQQLTKTLAKHFKCNNHTVIKQEGNNMKIVEAALDIFFQKQQVIAILKWVTLF